jgi:hypothetical protein
MTKFLVSKANKKPILISLGVPVLAAMTFAAAPQALKADDSDALCPLGNITLRGAYMTLGTGYIVGVGPISSIGVMTFDGKGAGALTSTASVNGVVSRGTISGPYTVNGDCSGSTDLSGGHYDFVAAPDGSRINWIATDPGIVLSGTALRLRPKRRAEGGDSSRPTE